MTTYFSEAFKQSQHRCAYCGKDLLADFESFMLSEEDHLVPKSKNGADVQENIVIACAVCNRLKGNFTPAEGFDPSKRGHYIKQCRAFIMSKKADKMADFMGWLELP